MIEASCCLREQGQRVTILQKKYAGRPPEENNFQILNTLFCLIG